MWPPGLQCIILLQKFNMEYTIKLFNQLADKLPPLVPDDLVYRIRKELKDVQTRPTSLSDLEKIMVIIGYEIWPYRQAFKEVVRSVENRLGEEFFVSHLTADLQKKYKRYQRLNMTWSDVHSGRVAGYFIEEERVEMSAALLEMHKFIRKFAEHEMVGIHREKYLRKVEDFKETLQKIKISLENLRSLARSESEHPMLANEILSRVESFEHGLCLLAPEFEHEEVERMQEHFRGRRLELGRLRGIHESIEIDFYN